MLLFLFPVPGILLQLAAYMLSRRLRHSETVVLLVFLLLYCIAVPYTLSPGTPGPQTDEEGNPVPQCGMPILATYMLYALSGIVGGGLTVATHLFYTAGRQRFRRQNV